MQVEAHRPQLGHRLFFVATIALISCSSPTDPSVIGANVELLPTPYSAPPGVQVVGTGAFVVYATIAYPCAPYALRASGHREGALLVVRVEGHRKDGCFQDVTGVMSYRLDAYGVPAGRYQLRVINEHREWDTDPDTVLAQSVDVP